MLCGQFEVQIRHDGSLILEDSEERILTKMILKYRGKVCSVCFDINSLEIVFSFEESLQDDNNLIAVSSFVTGNNIEEIMKQFSIPKEYLEYYPEKSAFIIGLMEQLCVSRKEVDMGYSRQENFD